jgi:hypothetical protein
MMVAPVNGFWVMLSTMVPRMVCVIWEYPYRTIELIKKNMISSLLIKIQIVQVFNLNQINLKAQKHHATKLHKELIINVKEK